MNPLGANWTSCSRDESEINTIGAKANSIDIANAVVEIKSVLEKSASKCKTSNKHGEVKRMALPHLAGREALSTQKAQEMRSKRAELRARLKKGTITLREVLESADDEVIAKMRVSYLIQSLPQVGKVTSKKIMDEIGINENRRVQGLGKRQIDELLKKLG